MNILSVDVGGTFIKYAAVNEFAEISNHGKIPTPKDSHEKFLRAIAELYTPKFDGIAISMPGIIDAEKGICELSIALPHNNGKNIVAELQKICKTKVSVENDANCAALAEARLGSLSDVRDGFVMLFGTSIGGAFIKNHEVHKGSHNLAGEVLFLRGFSDKNFFGETCSVPALLKNYAETKNIPVEEMTGEKFFKAIDDEDIIALRCLNEIAEKIAAQIFNIQVLLDVEKFAIGGGISAQKNFIDAIKISLDNIYKEVEIPRVEVVPCKFLNDANLIGAAMSFRGCRKS